MTFDLGRRSEIRAAPGVTAGLGSLLASRYPERDLLLVTDDQVARCSWFPELAAGLEAAGGTVHFAVVPAGEEYKTLDSVGAIYRAAPVIQATTISIAG